MQKINTWKIICIVSANVVQGCLSEIFLFIAQNIFDTKYLRFMVSWKYLSKCMCIPDFFEILYLELILPSKYFRQIISISTAIEVSPLGKGLTTMCVSTHALFICKNGLNADYHSHEFVDTTLELLPHQMRPWNKILPRWDFEGICINNIVS